MCIIVISVTKTANGDVVVYKYDIPSLYPGYIIDDMQANFGPGLPYEGLHAQVVYAEPPDACSAIAEPPTTPSLTGKWVVLIARYNCSFEEKVRWAQNASYDGVIVHNVNSDNLEPMSAKNPFGIRIPSVFIGESGGAKLKEHYQYKNDYFVVINSERPWNFNSQLLLPFAIVVGICLVVMIVIMIVKFVKDRMRQRRHRLPCSSLKKIPICKFSKGDPYETCAICLDDYVEGEKLRVLPCAHAYHCKCIDPWLTKNRRVCPVCKRKVFAHDEQPVADSDSDSDADDTSPLITNTIRNTHGTFARQNENPFQRAARSVSQIQEGEQGYQNEGMFVTASGDHSINTEAPENDSSSYSSTQTDAAVVPSTSDNTRDRDLVI